jgi:hypothetical protein
MLVKRRRMLVKRTLEVPFRSAEKAIKGTYPNCLPLSIDRDIFSGSGNRYIGGLCSRNEITFAKLRHIHRNHNMKDVCSIGVVWWMKDELEL